MSSTLPDPGSLDAPPEESAALQAAVPDPAAAEPVPESVRERLSCPQCQAPRGENQAYCFDCGWIFPREEAAAAVAPAEGPPRAVKVVKGRYEIGKQFSERLGVIRCLGRDCAVEPPVPVVIVYSCASPVTEPVASAEVAAADVIEEHAEGEILPTFDDPWAATVPVAEAAPVEPVWPTVSWEKQLLEQQSHPALPRVLDFFIEVDGEYLIEEIPAGRALWDAWDDPAVSFAERFDWLGRIVVALEQLHQTGLVVEALRPDDFVIADSNQPRWLHVPELLPLPLPPDPPLRGSLYAAPELLHATAAADARASLYSIGAVLYSLFLGRELTEMDFDRQGVPKSLLPSFPDIHPLLGRLLAKTFCKNVADRFPSDEAANEDPTGFAELKRVLSVCAQSLDNVRLDIAAWTTTGIVRTGNEDAFTLLHHVSSSQDQLRESALVLLADGMGGNEAGEIAAALALQTIRAYLLQDPAFADFQSDAKPSFTPQAARDAVWAALKEANRVVLNAARTGTGKRGMGCTAEVVVLRGEHFVVGHVGDSRTYFFHEGRITQLTRDQTLVNRLVELGTLTQAEAEEHPRRSELQQAIGGRAEVEPAILDGTLKAGDWLLVCSDGLTNHVTADEMKQMLELEATSAEMAARRLVNFVNLRGATDNTTVVVIRAT